MNNMATDPPNPLGAHTATPTPGTTALSLGNAQPHTLGTLASTKEAGPASLQGGLPLTHARGRKCSDLSTTGPALNTETPPTSKTEFRIETSKLWPCQCSNLVESQHQHRTITTCRRVPLGVGSRRTHSNQKEASHFNT